MEEEQREEEERKRRGGGEEEEFRRRAKLHLSEVKRFLKCFDTKIKKS